MADHVAEMLAPQAMSSSLRSGRKLSDKILVAFHHACDQNDLDAASRLLDVASEVLTRSPSVLFVERRRSREALIAAYERLWHLRHRDL